MIDNKYERGFILLSRDLLDSSLWNLPPDHFRVAIYLLLKARHRNSSHRLPDGTTIGRGELVTSMLSISENCSFYENRTTRELSRKKVLNILVDLEKLGFISRNSHRKGTHISICNYDTYQDVASYKSHSAETKGKQSGNTEGTQRDTNKNGNKEKKDNIDWEDFINRFNTASGKNARVVSERVRRNIRKRLKEGYTLDDIINATEHCANNAYHQANPEYLTIEFIARDTKLAKYLDAVSKDYVFEPDGRSAEGVEYCRGLTRAKHIEKYGRTV